MTESGPDTQCCLAVCLILKSRPIQSEPSTTLSVFRTEAPDNCFFINVLPGAQRGRTLGLWSRLSFCIADSQSQHQALMCLWRENIVTILKQNQLGTADVCTPWLLWSPSFLRLPMTKHLLSSRPHPSASGRLCHHRIKEEICDAPTVGHNRMKDTPGGLGGSRWWWEADRVDSTSSCQLCQRNYPEYQSNQMKCDWIRWVLPDVFAQTFRFQEITLRVSVSTRSWTTATEQTKINITVKKVRFRTPPPE